MSESAQKEEKKEELINIYDMDAAQEIPLENGAIVRVQPYTDKLYLEQREELENAVNEYLQNNEDADVADVKEAEIKKELEKLIELGKLLIVEIKDYPDLPENWKALMAVEDITSILNTAIVFTIDEDFKALSFGEIVVPTACFFNGKVARQKHVLRAKTIDDSSKYALIISKQYHKTKSTKLGGKDSVTYKTQDQAKYDLYLEMLESVEGFANDKVPMRAGIMVIDYIFKGITAKK